MAVVWFRPEVRNEFCAATALMLVLMTVMDTLLQMCLLGLQEINEDILLPHDSEYLNQTLEFWKLEQ
jgi:hypothetical protein